MFTRLLAERSRRRLHFTLIDPEKSTPEEAERIAKLAREADSSAILVGGSLGVFEPTLSDIVRASKSSGLPVILFPGNINGLSPAADAVFFMSLVNSDDPYYITGVQAQAAMIVLRMKIEVIPTAYVIVGHGGAAGYVGRARPIPYDRPDLVAAYSLASAMMGAKVIYLEAGSGAPRPIPPEAISASRRVLDEFGFDGLLVVGGGINGPEEAMKAVEAGADGIVNGTIVERSPHQLREIVSAIRYGSTRA
ncbi:MAG: geranylgeranylglyceryl/heptaprenylglyceryl phosphate synthase [Acidilobus sp.]